MSESKTRSAHLFPIALDLVDDEIAREFAQRLANSTRKTVRFMDADGAIIDMAKPHTLH